MKDVCRGQVKHFASAASARPIEASSPLKCRTRYILCYQRFFTAMIADGSYDVIVVDIKENDEELIHVEFAITSGARRGEMVTVMTSHLSPSPLDLLGRPATLFVDNGAPRIEWS